MIFCFCWLPDIPLSTDWRVAAEKGSVLKIWGDFLQRMTWFWTIDPIHINLVVQSKGLHRASISPFLIRTAADLLSNTRPSSFRDCQEIWTRCWRVPLINENYGRECKKRDFSWLQKHLPFEVCLTNMMTSYEKGFWSLFCRGFPNYHEQEEYTTSSMHYLAILVRSVCY